MSNRPGMTTSRGSASAPPAQRDVALPGRGLTVVLILLGVMGVAIFGFAVWQVRREAPTRSPELAPDIRVTIPEGTNLADVGILLADAGVAVRGPLLTAENLQLEGELFPDTYRFAPVSSASTIIARMQKNYERRLAENNLSISRRQLIIASMLEKEVRTPEDMRLVAGIIEKRLAAGMALQIDAAVAYGVCRPEFIEGRYCNVSQANLVDNIPRDSAYNTYARAGLPAGPITNPGLAAIEAALNPQSSPSWYYLSAPDGTTIFSRTIEEHNRAKAIHLR